MDPVLITGGARRLGATMARSLVAAGYRVVIHARRADAQTESLCTDLNARLVLGDLSDPDVPARLVAEAGPLSGLINNASRFEFDSPASVTAADILAHIGPNLTAPVLLAQAFAASRPAAGVIINILDQKLSNLNPDFFSYTLTKAALAAASEMMAQAFAPHIRVCGIAPGITLPPPGMAPARFAEVWRANPLQRGAAPEDIAQAALYIMRTPSVTGTTLVVDGGEHLMHRPKDVSFE
ncbi:MAG: SDR family oxidoreductase [Acidocella sp.]|nr:SDR family oxidoreductase [Acidocella sp.]